MIPKERGKKDDNKKIVRVLILALFLASAVLVTISTRTEANHLTPLSLSTSCSTGNTLFGKTYAKAYVTYEHSYFANHLLGPHNHGFSYSLYASVGYKVDQIPPGGGTAHKSVSSWTRFYGPKSFIVYVTSGDHELSDAYASASASETGNPDNWDFCPQ